MTLKICIAYFIAFLVLWLLTELSNSSPLHFNLFQMALFIVILRAGLSIVVFEIMDPDIWPYDWRSFTYCFVYL
jgi:hypothetical protein